MYNNEFILETRRKVLKLEICQCSEKKHGAKEIWNILQDFKKKSFSKLSLKYSDRRKKITD